MVTIITCYYLITQLGCNLYLLLTNLKLLSNICSYYCNTYPYMLEWDWLRIL